MAVRANAAVAFAAKVARERGHVSDADIAAVREAGFTDAQIAEIVALVALNGLTNFPRRGGEDRDRLPGRRYRRGLRRRAGALHRWDGNCHALRFSRHRDDAKCPDRASL